MFKNDLILFFLNNNRPHRLNRNQKVLYYVNHDAANEYISYYTVCENI